MLEVDLDRVIEAVVAAGPGAPVFEAYDRYCRLGGRLSLGQFFDVLVHYGMAVRRGLR